MSDFGDRLKLLRLECELTGTDLGKIFNFSRSAISNWEIKNRQPSQDILKQLAVFFDVSVDYLIGVSDVRKPVVEPIADDDVHSFTVELVKQLMKSGIIEDPDNIPKEITDMIIAALKNDIKTKKKGTKL